MAYIEGFVTPAPAGGQDAYKAFDDKVAPLFKEFGATRVVDAWADDVPDGKVTDFKRAVKARDDEAVVFGWMEYPDKATRDAAVEKMMSDPRMQDAGDMPFDGKRMIFGGFDPFVDETNGAPGGYVDGYLVPVPTVKRDAYRDMASKAAEVFKEYGATRVVEAWGDDVPDGKVTDHKMAVQAKDDETVVFSWCEWPDKAARDAAWPKMMEDKRMQPDKADMPFDGQRMIYGGFRTIVDV